MRLHSWIDRLRSRFTREQAQTMAEYAVILGVITPVIVIAFALFSDEVARLLDDVRKLFKP